MLTYFCQLSFFHPCKSPVLGSHTAFLVSFLFGKTNKQNPQNHWPLSCPLRDISLSLGFSSGYLLSVKARTPDSMWIRLRFSLQFLSESSSPVCLTTRFLLPPGFLLVAQKTACNQCKLYRHNCRHNSRTSWLWDRIEGFLYLEDIVP